MPRGLLVQVADRERAPGTVVRDVRTLAIPDSESHSQENLAVVSHQNQLSQLGRRWRWSLRRCGLGHCFDRRRRGWLRLLWLRRHHNDYRLLSHSRVRQLGRIIRSWTKEDGCEKWKETPVCEPETAWKSRPDYREMREIEAQTRHAVYGRKMQTYGKWKRWRDESSPESTGRPEPRNIPADRS